MGSPGVTRLNRAGMTMTAENNGIKSQTLLMKNMRETDEATASRSVNTINSPDDVEDLMMLTLTMMTRRVMSFTRGSIACRRPLRLATDSDTIVSLRKCAALPIVFSTKPDLPRWDGAGSGTEDEFCESQSGIIYSFCFTIFPKSRAIPPIMPMPTAAEIT